MTVRTAQPVPRRRFSLPDKYKLFLMALPFLLLVLVFSYGPLFGWSYAFFDYRPGIPLSQENFVGFKWFATLFSSPVQRAEVVRVMTNTIVMSLLNIACSVLPVAFAVFLSEVRFPWYKKSVQVLTTLPNFISWVLVYSLFFALFNTSNGAVNQILLSLGLIEKPTNILINADLAWAFQICISVWKNSGWNAIIYFAAITGIDQELYDAADVDGAGTFQKILHVTVPGLMSTFFVLLLMSIANMLSNGFEQYYVFQNALTMNKLEVLDTYIYKIGLSNLQFSLSTAMGIFKSLVSIVLLTLANLASKAIRGESIF